MIQPHIVDCASPLECKLSHGNCRSNVTVDAEDKTYYVTPQDSWDSCFSWPGWTKSAQNTEKDWIIRLFFHYCLSNVQLVLTPNCVMERHLHILCSHLRTSFKQKHDPNTCTLSEIGLKWKVHYFSYITKLPTGGFKIQINISHGRRQGEKNYGF